MKTTKKSNNNKLITIHIIGGTGKMGQWLAQFFKDHNAAVTISGRNYLKQKDYIKKADIIIVSVPISLTEEVIKKVNPLVRPDALLTDTTSVKIIPTTAMSEANCGTLGMHPLFGPTIGSTIGQKVIFCQQKDNKYVEFLRDIFEHAGFEIIEMSAEEHDYQMAYIQSLTHAVYLLYAKALLGQEKEILTKLQTPTFALHALTMGRILGQDMELMADIQLYNPYFHPVYESLLENAQKLSTILQKGDKKAFEDLFKEELKNAKQFAGLSLFQTNKVLRAISEFPPHIPTALPIKQNKITATVAFLGPHGTYSQEAAKTVFPKARAYTAAESIYTVFQQVVHKKADFGIVPAENSLEGTVRSTMDYLADSSLFVCGSLLMPIHHQLLSYEKKLLDIHTVVSHPQALAQCKKWLDKKLPKAKIISMDSTTVALESIKKNYGYIASNHAATVYNIPILAQNIEDTLSNTTRFYVISQTPTKLSGVNDTKTLIFLTVYNRVGILKDILTVLAEYNLNLLKLESRPSQEKLWDYHFFVEIEAKKDDVMLSKALVELESYCPVIRILGQT